MKTLTHWGRTLAFIALSSIVMVTASERVYWYLGGATPEVLTVAPFFYLIPVVVGLWAIGSGPSVRLHQVVLAGAIYAFITEGVLTPVIYQDGPLPLMAALFVGWHGMFSVVLFWYLTRRYLLERERLKIAVGSAVMGAYWGVWSISYAAPEVLSDFEETHAVMGPMDFAVYALVVGAVFAAAHWLLGFVWPTRFKPGPWARRGIVALCVGYGALAVLPMVPWAPVKLAVLVGGTAWLLRRSREHTPGEPSAIEALQGRVQARDVALLLILPLTAAITYAGVWAMDLHEGAPEIVYGIFSGVQVVTGLVAFIWAARQALRTSTRTVGRGTQLPVP